MGRLKDPKDETKGRELALTGDGSIFETLFLREVECGKPIPFFFISQTA